MTVRRLVLAWGAALLVSACGNVKPDWGFEEQVDWDIGQGSSRTDTDGDAGATSVDPCADADSGACDPFTNAGCDADAGYACSYYADSGAFACLSDSTEPADAACDAAAGPWCGPGLACALAGDGASVCVPFCCADEECAGGGPCTPFDYPNVEGPFGYCAPLAADAGI